MRIQNNLPTNPYTSGQKAKAPISPNFSGARLPQQSLDKLEAWFKKKSPRLDIPALLSPKYSIGRGRDGEVYRLNQHPFFLLKVFHDDCYKTNCSNQIMPLANTFPEYNFGQAIAILQNNCGKYIQVILKQEGKPNGIQNWSIIRRLNIFPKANIPEFISQLKKVKNMPQEAYNLLTAELKIIIDKVQVFDFYNPQNILIHEKKQVFNPVDTEIRATYDRNYSKCIPSCLLYSLIDEMNFLKVLNSANIKQKQELLTYVQIIKSKVEKAAQNNSIRNDESSFENILNPASFIVPHQKIKALIEDFSF